MRNAIIGIIIGVVVGVVLGATAIAPRLQQSKVPAAKPVKMAQPVQVPPPVKPRARPVVRWRMASAYSGALPQIGALAKRVGRNVWRVSGGGFDIKFFEPDVLSSNPDLMDAVSGGTIDAAFASAGLWGDTFPVLNFFSSLPFGPSTDEYLAWIYFGGGQTLADRFFASQNIQGIFCGLTSPAGAGWFRQEIITLEDLEGLKIRFTGLGGKTLKELGVDTQSQQGEDIFVDLEANDIQGAEYSMPSIDLNMKFYEIAKNYYFPGWHRPMSMYVLMINLDRWNSLSGTRKTQVETVCGDNIRHGMAESEAAQFKALKELSAKGVRIRKLSTEILEALKTAWAEVARKEAAADPDFKRAWQSLSKFRKEYAIWKELGHL